MPQLHAEALMFCLIWAALAMLGFATMGVIAGALLSVGMLLLIMPVSSLVLAKTGSFERERLFRWGILAAAALAFATARLMSS